MKLTTASSVDAPREAVFAALVDPEILKRSIPGCEELIATSPDTYEARLKIGVAGMKGSYRGTVTLRDLQPPDSFSLTFDGKGGPGFVRGTAAVRLSENGSTTAVSCEADVMVGGLIAAIGSRLVEAATRKLAADFFRQLASEITASR
jgi:carbon monoxide dehydrogenase subunit G